ncbi:MULTISPECIES: NAD(P)H-dependent oxidoreductase subunit E [Kordiimonas]|uniref:NAD(P)H-dependent oxidoreductase subunit E n=1 Tax=Kordiimonas TaxID=288021 RepID=UPI00257D9948|nr:NAD(P)H-dependent oxidoreductase subunit E [Kordiimonas sp. UBA4487]
MAEDTSQPRRMNDDLITAHVGETGGLMRALNALQQHDGYIDAALVPKLAKAFNITKAEVKGVISFYDDFTKAPKGKHVIRICQAEACQAVGSRGLTAAAIEKLGIGLGETTPDGRVTVEAVYCLGLCASGPAAMVDGQLKGRVSAHLFDAYAEEGEA